MAPQTPEERDYQLGEHLAAGALEQIMALYAADATFVTGSGETLVGTAAIRASFEPLAAAKPTPRRNLVRVVHVAADLAVICNDWTATVSMPDGSWRFVFDDPYARGA